MTPVLSEMCRPIGLAKPVAIPGRQHQRGFAAVAAIFLVVVLAALGGFMLTFSNTQQLTSAQDLQGTRAYWAAQAGLEWGIGTASAVADPATITMTTCSTSTPLSIGNFSVSVQCTPTVYAEAGVNKTMILLNATASLAGSTVGSIGFVERNLSATIER